LTSSPSVNNSSTSISTASPTPPQKSPMHHPPTVHQHSGKPPPMHGHLPPHHQTPVDVKNPKMNSSTSPTIGLTAQNAYHEDPEAFRWVTDYNRDPVSFIR
jgi:uncharacterized protein (DUF305 family)